MQDEAGRLETRLARIEGEFFHVNSRLAGVEADLRELRKSIDKGLDNVDTKLEARTDGLNAKLEAAVERIDAKIERVR